MVKSVAVAPDGSVEVGIYLTISGCPMRDRITSDVTAAVSKVAGVTGVRVELDVMSDEQRQQLRSSLQGGRPARTIPFAEPGSLTRVFAVASGKGGVGKSSTTVNLAVAMARQGLTVGVVDADVYGHSLPRMLGVDHPPAVVDGMIMPPEAHGVKVVSAGMFVEGNRPIVWRGPMLHRALEQLLADVYWGDLDVLLLDLPPGTGDIAISVRPAAARRPRSSSSRRRRSRRARSPSAPVRSRCRPGSGWPASSRTWPGCPARTAARWSTCSARAAASTSPTR